MKRQPHLKDTEVAVSFEVARWRSVDSLIHWLKTQHGATLSRRAEGPDARTFVLNLPAGELVVYQWDTGDVTIRGSSDALENLLRQCEACFAGQ